MGDGCNRPDSNSGVIAASNFEESVTVSARESTQESQATVVKIQQIEAHSSRSHRRDSNMASQLSQAREYWLKELSSDAVECNVDANAIGEVGGLIRDVRRSVKHSASMLVPHHRHRQDRLFCSSQHAAPGPPERRHLSPEPCCRRATAFAQGPSSGTNCRVAPGSHPLSGRHSD